MARMYITRPKYDNGTAYLHAWSEEVIKSAEIHEWTIDKSEDRGVTKKEVQSRLKKVSADFVFLNGHGNQSSMCGHNSEVILNENSSNLLKDIITFSRACCCVTKLGKSAAAKGCRGFIGYSGEFWVPRINKYEATPLKDPAAKPVLEASNAVPLAIIKNSTVSEAINSSKRIAIQQISKLISSKEPYDIAALKALSQNDDLLTYEADDNARVE